MIGAVCLLLLAAVAALNSSAIAPLDIHHSLAPLWAHAQEVHCGWEIGDGIPVSLSIENDGERDDRLIAASTPVALCVRIQSTTFTAGREQTEQVSEGILIPAGESITFEAGKSHLTLFGLRTDLVQGKTFPLTLCFDHAGASTVMARVRRKVDAAGTLPLPPVSVGDLTVARASAPPASGFHHDESTIWVTTSSGSIACA